WRCPAHGAAEVPSGRSDLRGADQRALGSLLMRVLVTTRPAAGVRRRLILWDIDSTLVEAGPLGRALYGTAFERATCLRMRVQGTTYGRLDPDIYRDTLLAHDLDPAAHPFPAFARALAAAYSARAAELRERGRALPGAAAALAALAARPEAVQTVLTGNLRTVAR